ncbi:MAG: enoyl-CoA hydratase/isomerase family protein [Erythrobacter sp.]|nr:enoyl-CoA hydratase/isomerase family protein [Erythrobacter sp.]
MRAMRACPAPIVLGIHGAAVAGGCALLGGADVVVADRNTKLGYPVVKIGVSPAVSSPFMLASMHPGVVRNRLVDTDLVTAERAFDLGMVHELADSPELMRERALEISASLAAKPGLGCIATKQWLNEISEVDDERASAGLDASLELTGGEEERTMLAALWG